MIPLLEEIFDRSVSGEGLFADLTLPKAFDRKALTVRLVNAHAVRNHSPAAQEFTTFATSLDLPELVPPGEVWISDTVSEEEHDFLVHDAEAQLLAYRDGANTDDAYDVGVAAERVERQLNTSETQGGDHPTHDEILDGIYREKLGTIVNPDGQLLEVWLVNELMVREAYKTDWAEGGHGYVYPFIPQHEIWIGDQVEESERPIILEHEATERHLMRGEKIGYEQAHAQASKIEWQKRQRAKSMPQAPQVKDSYFQNCPRDESGHCLPKDEADRSGREDEQSSEGVKASNDSDTRKAAIHSENFKRWFGDWERDPANASKVVNKETGEPQETYEFQPVRVFHGGVQGITEFDKSKANPESLYGLGFYFTEDKTIAEKYQQNRSDYKLVVPEGEFLKVVRDRVGQWMEQNPRRDGDNRHSVLRHDLTEYSENRNGELIHKGGVSPEAIAKLTETGIKIDDLVRAEGTDLYEVYLNIRKPFDADKDKVTGRQLGLSKFWSDSMDDAYDLSSGKPVKIPYEKGDLDTPYLYEQWRAYGNETGELGKLDEHGEKSSGVADDITKRLQKLGYDGLTHMGGGRQGQGDKMHRVWIAFQPTQIKSVDNEGTFDPNNPNMTKGLIDYDRKHWITIGGYDCGDGKGKHCEGTRVFVNDEGAITKGPSALVGRRLGTGRKKVQPPQTREQPSVQERPETPRGWGSTETPASQEVADVVKRLHLAEGSDLDDIAHRVLRIIGGPDLLTDEESFRAALEGVGLRSQENLDFAVHQARNGGHLIGPKETEPTPSAVTSKGSTKEIAGHKLKKPQVNLIFSGRSQHHTQRMLKSFFGSRIDRGTIGAMANAPDQAEVHVLSGPDDSIGLSYHSLGIHATRWLYKKQDGTIYCENDSFTIDNSSSHRGKGVEFFVNQVQALREVGASHIVTCAAGAGMGPGRGNGGTHYNGYYTWPRFGYDGDIPETRFQKLPDDLKAKMKESRSILDLYALPGGKEWWKDHGSGLMLKFDLSDGSRSMKTLEAYLEERKNRAK